MNIDSAKKYPRNRGKGIAEVFNWNEEGLSFLLMKYTLAQTNLSRIFYGQHYTIAISPESWKKLRAGDSGLYRGDSHHGTPQGMYRADRIPTQAALWPAIQRKPHWGFRPLSGHPEIHEFHINNEDKLRYNLKHEVRLRYWHIHEA